MKIALCQMNCIMGDIAGNTDKVLNTLAETQQSRPDLLVFSELFIQGYPPSDLLEQEWFVADSMRAIDKICERSRAFPGTALLIGSVMPVQNPYGKKLANAALVISNGVVVFRQDKSLLPTYDVFSETRYFEPAQSRDVFSYCGEKLGISICEDAWNDRSVWPEVPYAVNPIDELVNKGATLLINLSGSPYHMHKEYVRYSLIKNHSAKYHMPFVYLNQIGGNDELVFDGNSMVFDAAGVLRVRLAGFEEALRIIDTDNLGDDTPEVPDDTIASLHNALCLGIRDYVNKCKFKSVLIGLSGGIDSAVTCALAVDALGKENVTGVTMPSRYSSAGSVDDSQILACNLGIEFKTIPIESMVSSFLGALLPHFEGRAPDLAEENIQARVRGTTLMALSNKFGSLLLSTGNKSEMAVGYCTLYGDMNGGLSVISDLPKTLVYKLAEYINRNGEIIPRATITKAPSAELRPDQKDQDTLPPYDILDTVLELLVEKGWSRSRIVAAGFDEKTVNWIADAVRKAEYKRRQAAPGIKVTPKAFGCGRRFPLAAQYRST